MSRKADGRSAKTREKIWNAYISLLQENNEDEITVKQVCSLAKVNRSTYYAYYFDLNDLILKKEDEMNRKILQELRAGGMHYGVGNREDLLHYLSFVKDNASTFYACFRNGDKGGLHGEIRELMRTSVAHYYPIEKYESPTVHALVLEFYEEGLYKIIRQWILGGCVEPKETLVTVIQSCMKKS